jgi:hypothetical protein
MRGSSRKIGLMVIRVTGTFDDDYRSMPFVSNTSIYMLHLGLKMMSPTTDSTKVFVSNGWFLSAQGISHIPT